MSGWLTDTFIYTGLLIGAVLVLRRPVGRLFGPQIAYALWALPLVRLLLPPIVLPAQFAPEPAPVLDAAPGAVQWIEPIPALPAEPATTVLAPLESAPVAAPTAAWDWTWLGEVALSLWAGGALAFLAWRVVTYRRMRRELLAEARPVGEIGKVRLVETPALAAPVAFGVADKVIALPPRFMAQADIAARDLAIEHELAHHRGQDLLANFAAQALLALHWFNPLAWYGWRAMRRDQEAACDARVLAGRGREDRLRYAALIVGTAAGPRLALAAPMACPVLGERSIVHRLRSLARSDLSSRRRWAGRAMVAAGAFALPLTASISYSAGAQAPEPAAAPGTLAAPLPPETPLRPEALTAKSDDPGALDAQAMAEAQEVEENAEPVTRHFALVPPAPAPAPMPAVPRVTFTWSTAAEAEFEKQMEKWADEMAQWGERWGEEYGRNWEDWGEQQRELALAVAESERERALARAERQREQADRQREHADRERDHADRERDGAEREREQAQVTREHALAVAERQRTVQRAARSSLRGARASIAANPEISEEVRRELLRDLDREIARMERDQG